MKQIIITNVPDEVSKRFKMKCAENSETQREALIRLMIVESETRSVLPVERNEKIS